MRFLRYLYLAYFSHPKAERNLYRLIRRRKIRRLAELGIGVGLRSARMIETAQNATSNGVIRFTGVDLFEARPSQGAAGLPLKEAYRRLKATGIQPQLVPGDPCSALARVANGLAGTELVVISADQDPDSLAQAWFYLPRLLTPDSLVFCEEADATSGEVQLRQLTPLEISQRVSKVERRRAA